MSILSYIHSQDKETRRRWGSILSFVLGLLFLTVWIKLFHVWTGSLAVFDDRRKEESSFSFWQSTKEAASLLWSGEREKKDSIKE